MQGTKCETLTVNAVGARTPTKIFQAGKIAVRVLVRNVGAGLVFIATAVEEVNPQQGPTTGTYRLPAAQEDVFVLPPNTSLFALSIGLGARLSISVSEAVPFEYLKS